MEIQAKTAKTEKTQSVSDLRFLDMFEVDSSTRNRLYAAKKLIEYKPNNPSILSFHKSNSKVRLLLGGLRSGKTTAMIVEFLWAALGIHPFLDYPNPPLKLRLCAVDFPTIKQQLLPTIYDWAPRQAIKKFWADDRILEFVNGSFIDFRSYDQDISKFQGVERHLIGMDEMPTEEIYKASYMRTVSASINGKIIIAATPLVGQNWFWLYDQLYNNPEAKPPFVEYWHISTYDNPHLSREALEAVIKDPIMREVADAALQGHFITKSGLVYPQYDESVHVIKPIEHIPDDWVVAISIDPHDRNPHAVIFAGLTKDNYWVVFDELLFKGTLDEFGKAMQAKLGNRFPPDIAVIDTFGKVEQSTSQTSVEKYLSQKFHIYFFPASKDVMSGILKVQSYLAPADSLPKLYITENCYTLRKSFRNYIWDEWSSRRQDKWDPKEKPVKRGDDLLDALRYLIMLDVRWRHPQMKFRPSNVCPLYQSV